MTRDTRAKDGWKGKRERGVRTMKEGGTRTLRGGGRERALGESDVHSQY